MSENPWPWSREEEAFWEEQLRQQEFGWMEELIDHMVAQGLASSAYDPLEGREEAPEEELIGL
jgi:hypothetical protein